MQAYFKTQFPIGSGWRLQQTLALLKQFHPTELELIQELSHRWKTLEKEESETGLARARFRMMLREIVRCGGIPRRKITQAMLPTFVTYSDNLYDD